MKNLLFTIIAFFVYFTCQAQDILIKRNGDELEVKVLEIDLEAVKYKRFDNLEGPIISIAKADVFMIKYENGTKVTMNEMRPAVQQPVYAQRTGYPQENLKLGGPRLGFTVLSQKYIDHISNDYDTNVNAFMTQFGWQFETRVFTLENGTSGLFEFVPLIGGLEQGKFLPSLSALVGIRSAKGLEFGLGPNVSLGGAGIVLAVGTNFQSQGVNFPVNFAVAPSKDGARFSLLFGFNSRKY
ncbi:MULTISPECIES: hypothetical protein [Pontibacter]|uniref:Uncharacterized protein n=1 Tax=Pontibacter lucknowensis TaxID=1077936 RepID=A0A1N6XKH1_9BACT|nr:MULTISPECIES: hypothetical protein [Pontibacter]EJF08551.1 hypothetical protein O71_20107 [Pontibacter sp. BAB1700]SIR02803.1 hypothetical protein SAMN05421545_2192 [Pontibacter lucknowensis]